MKAARRSAPRVKWNPHLSFNGDCEVAFELYAKVLGGKIVASLTYGDSPMAGQTPASFHVELPLQETFWAKRFGMVVDPFGTPWLVECSS